MIKRMIKGERINTCSVCNKPMPYSYYEENTEIQCSIECAEKAYKDNPSFCVDCNKKLTYYEAFAGGMKCNFCIVEIEIISNSEIAVEFEI